ncbi:hypothetical protein FQN57_003779 [Myotisia sp. PD_48]|nr:hypothetical protein FQN57_003779 [Myotisia sp. PD_48]
MDAKSNPQPQRLTRILRSKGDENLVPGARASKTIHQRNKSTPALSTIAGLSANKDVIKRTAFGDVSNTVNVYRPAKDDHSLLLKDAIKITEKPVCLARPAQRPIHSVTYKPIVNNAPASDSNSKAGAEKATAKKIPSQRNNVVFKDPILQTVAEEPPVPAPSVEAKDMQPISSEILQTDTKPTIDDIEESLSQKHTDNVENAPVGPNAATSKSKANMVSIYPENKGNPIDGKEIDTNKVSKADPKKTARISNESDKIAKASYATTHSRPNDSISIPRTKLDQPLPYSEPEEYWEDEDEEHYEEEGYVTARSYRSRSDNTTGATTMVLFPKATQETRRELAFAKRIVNATTSPDEFEEECWDTTMVAEYGDEIFEYMRELELKLLPNAHYMDNQAEIQWSMRSVLMDWLIQVHHRFTLLPETLFLCVNYIDRFLSCKIVSLGKLQLVGATAIFIAAKYEEINCPSVQEIVYMVDNGYTVDEILKAERYMLTMLQFELGWPGPMSFLRRISKADNYDLETRTLAKYFLEITIMDERFVGSPPSYIAAGAHCLARLMLRKGDWSPAHVYHSNYTFAQLHPLITIILECCKCPQRHHLAVYEKYADKRFKRASYFVEKEVMDGYCVPEIHEGSSLSRMHRRMELYN